MRNEIQRLLQTDFMSFACKAIRELDGTVISKDRYLEYLASKLTEFADRKIKRMLVNMPPRHLKTLLGSVCLAAWILAHKPNTKIMVLCCSQSLAEEIARSIRTIMMAKWYRDIFSTKIKKGHAEATNFVTTAGGRVFAASIHAIITGHGADVIIVDDPHDISDAGKPQQRASVIDNFNSIVKSRLNNRRTGRFLVIAHRISDKDLSAHLIAKGNWEHVALPLLATRDETYQMGDGVWRRRSGELLRPDAEDDDSVAELKKTQVNPDFEMLFQQDHGQARLSITAEHFPIFAPDTIVHLPRVLSIDPGTTDGDDASFSVIQVWAFDARNYYLLAQYRAQCQFDDLIRKARHLRRDHRAYAILIENTANGPVLISQLKRKLKGRCLIVPITPRGSKSARLNRHIDKIHQGRVQLAAAFWAEFTDEIVAFPYGKYDDQVDAFTQVPDFVDQHGALAKPPQSMPSEIPMVVSGNSQWSGWGHRSLPTAKPGERGICAARGNSHYAPNGPFIQAKAWVVK